MIKGKVILAIIVSVSVLVAMLVSARIETKKEITNGRTSMCNSHSMKRAVTAVAIKRGLLKNGSKIEIANGKRNGNILDCTAQVKNTVILYQIKEVPKEQLATTPNVNGIAVQNIRLQ